MFNLLFKGKHLHRSIEIIKIKYTKLKKKQYIYITIIVFCFVYLGWLWVPAVLYLSTLNGWIPSYPGLHIPIDVLMSKQSFLKPYSCWGGGQFDPPCSLFLHNSKSIGLRLLKFSDFSYIPKALPLGLKPGFNTNCLSLQAHYLNDFFFL